jgi:proline racemase
MRWQKRISLVEAHAEGEVGRVITGGVLDVPGATMFDKKRHLETSADWLRRFCLFEPRGSAQMSVNLILPPTVPEADFGFIIMESTDYPPMSGSNTICTVTVALETGLVPMVEPETRLLLDTPAGLVAVRVACENGKAVSVAFDNVPCFVHTLDVRLDVPGFGPLTADIAYGGAFFAIVDAADAGFRMVPSEARAMVDLGERIKRAAVEQLDVTHPDNPLIRDVTFTYFVAPVAGEPAAWRNAIVVSPGRLDRCPCGTGCSARLAAMHARGLVQEGQPVEFRSLIGSRFKTEIVKTTQVAGRPAIVPRIEGRGFIVATHEFGVDPTDPWPLGYTLSDTWGDGMNGLN